MNIIDKNLSFGSMNVSNEPNMLIVHHLEAEGPNWTVEQIHNRKLSCSKINKINSIAKISIEVYVSLLYNRYRTYILLKGEIFK